MSAAASSPPAYRALVFRLPGQESTENAHLLMQALAAADVPAELSPYWPDGQPNWGSEAFLLEKEIGSAPRLSAAEFQDRFGFELDLVDLSMHQFATEPLTPDLLLPESIWRQHLRGVAVLAAERMKASGADVVFVPHGAETLSRILAEMAAHLGLRILYWESGFFPGYVYVDPWAPHFFRGEAWIDSLPLPELPSPEATSFLAEWRRTRQSKYTQMAEGLPPAVADWAAQDDRPILFLPGQVPTDANVVVNLGRHNSLAELYEEALKHVPDTWRVLYKPHPKASTDPVPATPLTPDRFFRADIGIHDALELCSAVLTVSSNVGLEAIMYGKPTFVLGKPIYAGRGITVDLLGPYALRQRLSRKIEASTDQAVANFLTLTLEETLVNKKSARKLKHLIYSSRNVKPPPRKSFYNQMIIAAEPSPPEKTVKLIARSIIAKIKHDRKNK